MTCAISPIKVVIKNGETTSDPIHLPSAEFIGLIWPAVLDGTKMYIEVSHHPTTGFVPMKHYSAGGYSITFATMLGGADSLTEDDKMFVPFSHLRFVIDAAQTADREFWIVGKG